MNELKPCPFCGSKKLEVHSERTVFIMCSSCETRGDYYDTEAEAIAAWNTRAERTCSNLVIEINRHTPVEFRTDNFLCSACREHFFADNERVNYPIDWAYCPNCGRKVVEE